MLSASIDTMLLLLTLGPIELSILRLMQLPRVDTMALLPTMDHWMVTHRLPEVEEAGSDDEPEPAQMGSRVSRIAEYISDTASVASNDSEETRVRYRCLVYATKSLRQLPRPSIRHPVSGNITTYKPPTDEVDSEFSLRALLDRRVKAAKAALNGWDTDVCMLSWVWESKLVDCGAEIEVVND
ncbi:hypothetical protein PF002_g8461 [Phytophthora fragariae]|uniref:Uncharacterized protein n=2 Tax=Phytophthora fragariae TaxID=53985 RepID=A0A6A3ZSP7_9STRA|nr:hypothetical protein PF002_g8461 [Phytophthora fragariae]